MELFIHWNPSPDAINLGFWTVKWYGVTWGVGLMSIFFIGEYILKKLGRDEEKLTTLILYMLVCALIGARLGQVLFYELDYFLQNPAKILAIWEGGLASHGGIAGAFLGMYIFCRRNADWPMFWTFDHAVIAAFFLACSIRIGNLINGEIVGKVTDVPWAFIFETTDTLPRHPVVLYESIIYFFIQLLMLFLFNRYKDSKPGLYLTVFFLAAFVSRFLIEFTKEPEGFVIAGISKTQLLNVPFIIAGLAMLYLVKNKKLSYNLPEHA